MANAITVPDKLEMIVGEQLNLQVDMANVCAAGDVISAPSVTVTNLSTNETVPSSISNVGTSGSTIITARLNSVALRKRTDYAVMFNCTATGGGNTKLVSALLIASMIY